MKLKKLVPLLPEEGVVLHFDDGFSQEYAPLNKYFDREVKKISAMNYPYYPQVLLAHVVIELEGTR